MLEFFSVVLLGPKFARARMYAAFTLFFLILAAGSIPNARAGIGQVASGLVLHSLAYSSITFLLWSGLNRGRTANAVLALLIVALMGAIDEFVQSFLPYRTASFTDWGVDCSAGVLTAWFCWKFLFQFTSSPPRPSQQQI